MNYQDIVQLSGFISNLLSIFVSVIALWQIRLLVGKQLSQGIKDLEKKL